MTNLASKDGKLILRDGKLAEDCACCGGWYCWSCDCGLSSVTLTITDFQSGNPSAFNPSVNGTYTMLHPSGVDACCEMWEVQIADVMKVTLFQNWYNDEPTLPTIYVGGENIAGGGGTALPDTPCNLRDGSFSTPQLVYGNYVDPSNSMLVASWSFKASLSGVA